jgi:quercetin dioxygenase-like cupin family protein
MIRRHFLQLAAAGAMLPAASQIASTQSAQRRPKLAQLLRADLQGQDQTVQETVVNLLEMAPSAGAPWHMHPGAQEIIFVIEGTLAVEIDGQGAKQINASDIVLIPAETAHLARNDSTAVARALVIHSRADKDKAFLIELKKPA